MYGLPCPYPVTYLHKTFVNFCFFCGGVCVFHLRQHIAGRGFQRCHFCSKPCTCSVVAGKPYNFRRQAAPQVKALFVQNYFGFRVDVCYKKTYRIPAEIALVAYFFLACR